MNGYIVNLENQTLSNQNFRKVLYTGPNSQLVVMTLQPEEDIGEEVHNTIDQIIVIKLEYQVDFEEAQPVNLCSIV